MTDLEKVYEVEDLEELDDNNLDGNNEEIDNVVDVKLKQYEPKFGMLFDNLDEMYDYNKGFGKQEGFPVKR